MSTILDSILDRLDPPHPCGELSEEYHPQTIELTYQERELTHCGARAERDGFIYFVADLHDVFDGSSRATIEVFQKIEDGPA